MVEEFSMRPQWNELVDAHYLDQSASLHSITRFKFSNCVFFFLFNSIEDGQDIQDALLQKTGQKSVPNVFVNGTHVGGCDNTIEASQNGRLQFLLNKSSNDEMEAESSDVKYDYDLVVIGGGSGGLAASKVTISQ